ncbi:uncharacterized protein LOC127811643 [Diospyros lotus]|uniref:uncharacterized protein LOC127811643 n=1 Tax=Diospyros lotus TaxID=55363 RepID=UPI002252E413|nr:uncharacterized protein LOC127811643 [Diospyros lotus]XP_052207634.1 uncharacterized protein LOC127811643 [Diospyros lotus]XP_052207635.1 uncharacterized protein LOC127811643 [Diospyros lotus]
MKAMTTTMIVNCGGMGNAVPLEARWRRGRRRPPLRMASACLASNLNAQQLRAQLDQLHSEAEHARSKANNARLRLMRLSEAAEKLRRQAALCVQTGKENDARDLLFQKKKVMEALEKSKSRITLLDELSTRLNEAISVKETQLIENVASHLDIGTEDTSNEVRIMSPKEDSMRNLDGEKDLDLDPNGVKFTEDEGLQVHTDGPVDLPIGHIADNLTGSLIENIHNEAEIMNTLKGLSSYEDFMEHLDQQLSRIEAELATVLRVSILVLEGEEKQKNLKVQQTMELLEDIHHLRERISSIKQTKAAIK